MSPLLPGTSSGPFRVPGLLALQGLGPYQGPAPIPTASFTGWMGWTLLIAMVVLMLLALSRNQDRRPPRIQP